MADRDNPHISRPHERWVDTPSSAVRAINCTSIAERIERFVRDSLAENTRRAYRSDLDAFTAWGGMIPASPETVAAYLAAHADLLAIATLQRRLASISKAHASFRLPNPVSAELVKATMRGIRRANTRPRREAKPLLKDDLFLALEAIGSSTKDTRDRALLLIGFAGGFRRSELVGLDVADIASVRQGIVITLRRSKTDQLGIGRQIGIPFGRARHCPVRALEQWLALSTIDTGPLFRPVSQSRLIADARLSGEAVSLIVKERITAVGIDPAGYSGHSLRAGFATSAAMAGASTWKIRAQTGHAAEAMLSRYIRQAGLFEDNACYAVL